MQAGHHNPTMGRAFLAPSVVGDEIWFNVGWTMGNAQQYAEWTPLFEAAISKSHYEEMVSKMKPVFASKAIHPALVGISIGLMPACGAGLICCAVMKCQVDNLVQTLSGIAAEYGGRAVLCQAAGFNVQYHAFDQFGQPLQEGRMGAQAMHSNMSPTWPPLGVNIVLPDKSRGGLRASWPKGGGVQMMMPQMMGGQMLGGPMAVPMGQVAPAVEMATPVVVPAEMVREQEGLADRIAKLANLKAQGVLSNEEFEKAKQQELAKG